MIGGRRALSSADRSPSSEVQEDRLLKRPKNAASIVPEHLMKMPLSERSVQAMFSVFKEINASSLHSFFVKNVH